MMQVSARTALAVAAMLLVATTSAQYTPSEVAAFTQDEDVSTTTEGRVIVRGAGATFPERLYREAIFAYRFVNESVDVSYAGMGSGNGKCRIIGDCASYEERPVIIDFAGSDSLLDDADYVTNPAAQMYPSVAGAVVPLYNLPALDESGHTLVLNLDILARIFRLNITTWNHTDILSLNADFEDELSDPDNYLISVVVREDSSGTSEIFKKTLAAVDPVFAYEIGNDPSNVDYEDTLIGSVTKRQGNEGVAGFVATEPGSIGYSVLGEALSLGISFASLEKSSGGTPVVASAETVSNALVEKGLDFASAQDEERLTVEVHNAGDSQAWPIVGYTYFVIIKDDSRRDGAAYDNVLAMQDFFEWFYENEVPRAIATKLAFAPLPDKVRALVLERLRSDLTWQGEPVYEEIDLSGTRASYFGTASLETILAQYQLVFEAERTDVTFEDFEQANSSYAFERATEEGVAFMLGSTVNAAINAHTGNPMAHIPYAGVAVGVLVNFCGASAAQQATASCNITLENQGLNFDSNSLKSLLSGNQVLWSSLRPVNPHIDDASLPTDFINLVVVESEVTDEFTQRLMDLIGHSGPFSFDCSVSTVQCVKTIEAQKSAIAATPLSIGIMPVLGSIPDLTEWARLSHSGGGYLGPSPENILACFEASDAYVVGSPSGPYFEYVTSPGCYPVYDTIDIVARRKYSSEPAGGCDREGKDFGLKNTRFIGFLTSEILEGEEVSLEGSPLAAEGALALYGLTGTISQTNFAVLSSISCDGVSILTPSENTQLVPLGFIIFAYVLTGMSILFCIAMVVWVQRNKTRRLLLVASPPFLLQILFGGILALCAIFPLAFQDDGKLGPSKLPGVDLSEDAAAPSEDSFDATLDLTCMLAPALYGAGFAVIYSSLWLKTWRQIRIFNDERLRLQYITNNKLRFYQLCLFTLLLTLFAFWWATDPMRYTRVIVEVDEEGNILESYGACRSDHSIQLAAPIIALLCLSLAYGLYLSFRSRNIPSEFNEGRFITIAVIAAFEVLAISIPVFFSTSSDPTTNFILQFFIIFVTTGGTVMLVFVPKLIIRYSQGWDNDLDGKSEISDDEMSDAGNFTADAFPFTSAAGSNEASLSFNTAPENDPFKASGPYNL